MASAVVVNVGAVPPLNLKALLKVAVLEPPESWLIKIDPLCPTTWLLGAAKVLLPPKVTEWWQAVAISIVIVPPSDNAVIFEAAPPDNETPPETILKTAVPPLCNSKFPVPASLIELTEPVCWITKSALSPIFKRTESPIFKELSDLSKTIFLPFVVVKVTSSLKLLAASTSIPPTKVKRLIHAVFPLFLIFKILSVVSAHNWYG